jgi:hypothetical protein
VQQLQQRTLVQASEIFEVRWHAGFHCMHASCSVAASVFKCSVACQAATLHQLQCNQKA